MNFPKHLAAGMLLAFLVSTSLPAHASPLGSKKKNDQDQSPARKLTAAQNALVDKAIVREQEVIKIVKQRAPIVETYIQNMRPDPVLLQVPLSDEHHLARVDFGKVIGDDEFRENPVQGKPQGKMGGFFKHSVESVTGLGASLHLKFQEDGFVRMMFMDSVSFNRQNYNFGFVRNDFLGSTPTAVFDVTPIAGKSFMPGSNKTQGKFLGRIWVETHNGNVVRFNGLVEGTDKDYHEYYHFDSWRTNVQDNLWLPTSFYVEESDPKSVSSTLKFKAINHIWGYLLKVPASEASNTSLEVEGATDVSNDAQDVGPLGAQRAWVQQAEDNVVERLYQAGLIDAPSDFDKTLEALAGNILAYNNIVVSRPIRVRTLLTEPLESTAIGNTIILSKGLIDTTGVVTQDGAQQMGNLNAILAFQIAHIILGHRLDTKYAFNDRMLFPTTSVFQRIPMHHTADDNAKAAKKAMELLNAKELVDGQKYFGLYLEQLRTRVTALKALNEPMLGDGLVKSDIDNAFWMQSLVPKGDKLDVNDLKQQAAMPLESFLRYDPWTDQVITLHSAYEPILSSADKMPFEVVPVYLKLSYYKAPDPAAAPAPAPAGAAAQQAPAPQDAAPATVPNATPAATPDATQPPPPPPPAQAAPDATTGTAAPPPATQPTPRN
jgi:hypothetical protein